LFYVLSILSAVVGVTVAIVMRARHALVMYIVLVAGIFILFYKLRMITPPPRQTPEDETRNEGSSINRT